MKALVLEEISKLVMKELPDPVPGDNEVLIRTAAATICTSDINDITLNPFGIRLPMVMGHEGSGIVEAVGKNVTEFAVGDAVMTHPVIPCGECASCKRNLSHLCDEMGHLGINTGGTFSTLYTLRKDRLRRKPENISFAVATLMEPVCVSLQAIERANVREAENILIIGDGPFGVMIANICAGYKDKKTILLGRHEFRMAQTDGVITLNEKTCGNVDEEVNRITGGHGIDSAIICVGSAKAVNIAVASLRSRGTVCIFSAIHEDCPVDFFKIHVKELNICGSCNDMDCLDEAVRLLSEGVFDKMITHQLPFEKFKEAFDISANKKNEALKVSLIMEIDK